MGAKWQGRLLLVEDENLLRGLIAQFLRGEGFELVEAADGREGVERYSSLGPFDIVLLDLNLPVFSGVEVCRRIKHLHPGQPVIICSAAILDGHMDALESLNVDQFLSKPYHPKELLNRIAIEFERAAHLARRVAREPVRAGLTPGRSGPCEHWPVAYPVQAACYRLT